MRWPGRTRPDGTAGGSPAPITPPPRDWATLPPPRRAIDLPALTADPGRFEQRLATWEQTGVTRAGLGHLLSEDAPGGQVHGIVRVLADQPAPPVSSPPESSPPVSSLSGPSPSGPTPAHARTDPLLLQRRDLTAAPDPRPLPRALPVAVDRAPPPAGDAGPPEMHPPADPGAERPDAAAASPATSPRPDPPVRAVPPPPVPPPPAGLTPLDGPVTAAAEGPRHGPPEPSAPPPPRSPGAPHDPALPPPGAPGPPVPGVGVIRPPLGPAARPSGSSAGEAPAVEAGPASANPLQALSPVTPVVHPRRIGLGAPIVARRPDSETAGAPPAPSAGAPVVRRPRPLLGARLAGSGPPAGGDDGSGPIRGAAPTGGAGATPSQVPPVPSAPNRGPNTAPSDPAPVRTERAGVVAQRQPASGPGPAGDAPISAEEPTLLGPTAGPDDGAMPADDPMVDRPAGPSSPSWGDGPDAPNPVRPTLAATGAEHTPPHDLRAAEDASPAGRPLPTDDVLALGPVRPAGGAPPAESLPSGGPTGGSVHASGRTWSADALGAADHPSPPEPLPPVAPIRPASTPWSSTRPAATVAAVGAHPLRTTAPLPVLRQAGGVRGGRDVAGGEPTGLALHAAASPATIQRAGRDRAPTATELATHARAGASTLGAPTLPALPLVSVRALGPPPGDRLAPSAGGGASTGDPGPTALPTVSRLADAPPPPGDAHPPAATTTGPPPGLTPSAPTGPTVQRAGPAATGGAGGRGSGASMSPHELDELSRKLYERLRTRLAAELRLDRERTGSLIDPSF